MSLNSDDGDFMAPTVQCDLFLPFYRNCSEEHLDMFVHIILVVVSVLPEKL